MLNNSIKILAPKYMFSKKVILSLIVLLIIILAFFVFFNFSSQIMMDKTGRNNNSLLSDQRQQVYLNEVEIQKTRALVQDINEDYISATILLIDGSDSGKFVLKKVITDANTKYYALSVMENDDTNINQTNQVEVNSELDNGRNEDIANEALSENSRESAYSGYIKENASRLDLYKGMLIEIEADRNIINNEEFGAVAIYFSKSEAEYYRARQEAADEPVDTKIYYDRFGNPMPEGIVDEHVQG